jgi:DNA polymerase/3'-5' exonuclease PolX
LPGYFRGIADLLELKGKSIFKIRAYQEVERVIKYLSVEEG